MREKWLWSLGPRQHLTTLVAMTPHIEAILAFHPWMCYFVLLECHHVGRAGIGASPMGSVSRASKSVTCEMPVLVRGDYTILRKARLKVDEQDMEEYSIREGSVTGCLCSSAGTWHIVRRAMASCTEGTCLVH
jgi:hypothetical protein